MNTFSVKYDFIVLFYKYVDNKIIQKCNKIEKNKNSEDSTTYLKVYQISLENYIVC